MSQLGPLAGAFFLAGGAVAGRFFAEGKWAETSADMLMHLASHKASEWFGSAAEGFQSGHNGDAENAMKAAALAALGRLRASTPDGFDDWFAHWLNYLTLKPATEISRVFMTRLRCSNVMMTVTFLKRGGAGWSR